MISFRLKDEAWINPFLQSLSLITFAESLGGVESLMTYIQRKHMLIFLKKLEQQTAYAIVFFDSQLALKIVTI